jgi:hypothetical protein
MSRSLFSQPIDKHFDGEYLPCVIDIDTAEYTREQLRERRDSYHPYLRLSTYQYHHERVVRLYDHKNRNTGVAFVTTHDADNDEQPFTKADVYFYSIRDTEPTVTKRVIYHVLSQRTYVNPFAKAMLWGEQTQSIYDDALECQRKRALLDVEYADCLLNWQWFTIFKLDRLFRISPHVVIEYNDDPLSNWSLDASEYMYWLEEKTRASIKIQRWYRRLWHRRYRPALVARQYGNCLISGIPQPLFRSVVSYL